MTASQVKAGGGLARASAEHSLRRASASLKRLLPSRRRTPTRLIMAPQDLRTSDPTIAHEIYAGELKFAGKLLETHGRSPFDLPAPSLAFAQELHSFGWLRHLRAAETTLSRTNGRALVSDWIVAMRAHPTPVAFDPLVVARRVLSFVSQSPLLLDQADASFYRDFLKALGQDVRRLDRAFSSAPPTELRLFLHIARMTYVLASSDSEDELRRATVLLCKLLEAQILPDGGHVSRNPAVVLETLVDLLPLKLAFAFRKIQTPQAVVSAIDRMMLMVRMMRHADGAIGLFNGMSATPTGLVAAVIAQDDLMASAPSEAPHSGYQRIEANGSVLIVDAGATPPPPLANRAHAAPAALEFSAARQRIFINCGAPPDFRPDLLAYARVTAAHSTLVAGDRMAGRFQSLPLGGADLGEQLIAGATRVDVTRGSSAAATQLSISHDGYGRSLGLTHRRDLSLAQTGHLLEGRDTLIAQDGTADVPYVVRFHLHPLVSPTLSDDARSILLRLPEGERFLFEAGGLALALEESILFASPNGMRRTVQIAVYSTLATHASIAWTLRQIAKE